ncbi:hypothetical protein MF271_05665 [Deinococcus sp. KNUC1210]|uniref:hypothetical protein n=1 Tax=Deinococcus sp. KNUC1210 TaxID=2917691 RepID=UPI001EF0274D|nr:hypothetical protein [Deinococcus sp. KNUC1210]ULH16112.1 hypothetical protein MF271_05665 [Deinococcus sp. KNUC1210]
MHDLPVRRFVCRFLALALTVIGSAALAQTDAPATAQPVPPLPPPTHTARPTAGKPDLIVESAKISYSGVCRPGSVWANASVTVRNIGTATSGSRSDVSMVQVIDARDIELPSNERGQGAGLVALAPGQAGTLLIPVLYPAGETGYGGRAVSYFVRVNVGQWIDESDTTNNLLPDRITFVPSAADCP